ncbi:TonB-dependent receptor [Novosphingobium sp. PC22D]|uniref:TonB-dependent siderophore receptor n=1 Tax=Novosphingobium sp. PC22D TaxID=1962403 RepID=UPI0014399446|nr:TonB-dependent receptor [Novosphingobium sp. PC22D]
MNERGKAWAVGKAFKRLLAATALAGGMAPAGVAHAQETQAASTRDFDIPAQSLDDALIVFARQSGYQVSSDSGLTAARRSSAVSGTMAPGQALSRLLTGTGLTFRFLGANAVRIERAPRASGDGAIRLGPVRVEATGSGAGGLQRSGSRPVQGEWASSYAAPETPLQGNRLGQAALDTPRAVSVITRDLIDDVKPFSETEIMRYVSGITARNEYQGLYSSFMLRGVMADNSTNYLRDGARVLHVTEPLLFNVERVEVIKGPNAIDYGQTAPGGLINYVSKKPLATQRYAGSLSIGSNSWHRGELDLSGPVDRDGKFLYRVTGAYEEGGAYTDYVDPERWGGALSLTWNVSEDTALNVSVEYNDIQQTSNPGLPVPDPTDLASADAIGMRNFYGETTASFTSERTYLAAELTHSLGSDWQLRAQAAHDDFSRPTQWLIHTGLTPDGQSTNREVWYTPYYDIVVDTLRLELRGTLDTGPIEHSVLVGTDYIRDKTDGGAWTILTLPALDIHDPVVSSTPLDNPIPGKRRDDTRAWGIFLQDVMDFGNGWGAQFGLRYDRVRDKTIPETANAVSPNAALTFKPDDVSLLYVSYASSFEPNYNANLIGGGKADPSRGKQVEIGAKRIWLDGRMTTTAALFQLEKTNIPTPSNSNPGFSEQTGKVRIRGIELEASGEPVKGLNLIAQMTLLDPETRRDGNAAIVGKRLARSTKTTVSIWATYRLPDALDAWQIGGGLTHKGTMPIDGTNSVEVPDYTIADAFIGWNAADNMRLSANIRNLTDARYYTDATGSGGAFTSAYPGAPRSILLSLDARF